MVLELVFKKKESVIQVLNVHVVYAFTEVDLNFINISFKDMKKRGTPYNLFGVTFLCSDYYTGKVSKWLSGTGN